MKKLSLLLIFTATFCFGQNVKLLPDDREFSYKIFGNIANYFENEKDLLDFFEFKKGDVVAEVGAGNWQNLVGLSLLVDSITFWAQDIDAGDLHDKALIKTIGKTVRYKPVQTNIFNRQIGYEKETLLPDNSIDKIILSSAFHEFTYMDEMISDLYKKLRPGGKIYILEAKCLTNGHKNYTMKETEQIMKKHKFNLVKKDNKNIHGAMGLYRMMFMKK